METRNECNSVNQNKESGLGLAGYVTWELDTKLAA